MNRRRFFSFLPGTVAVAAAGVASIAAPKPRIEDVDGITVSKDHGLTISNCHFQSTDGPALVIRQA